MKRTIRGDRLHIAIFGKRNAGKSSIINAITRQTVSIVSDTPGTTADPVFKAMELIPIGAITIIDTAGLDDIDTEIGNLRVKRTENVLKKTDIAIIVVSAENKDFIYENKLIKKMDSDNIPYIIAVNKNDLNVSIGVLDWVNGKNHIFVSALKKAGIDELKAEIIKISPKNWEAPFIKDIISPGDIIVLVTPIDLGAPKGRMIMPQVKAIREILDADAIPILCKETELIKTLKELKNPPSLVITDSQVFEQVVKDIPKDVRLTSFSILSARQKGDLKLLIEGVFALKNLKAGDEVLIAEACTHHATKDDIGREKIPKWLKEYFGGSLNINRVQGYDFPDDVEKYKLIIHCGGCTLNGKEMKNRLITASNKEIPITNFGILISFLKSAFPRAIMPFKDQLSWVGDEGK